MSSQKVRVCPKCGWVVDAIVGPGRCPVCSTLYTEGYCCLCGEYTAKLVQGKYCRLCFSRRFNNSATRKWVERKRNENITSYNAWLDKIKQLPCNYHTLTEEEWLEACRHFNGCAFCGSESIDARAYFISFREGGRYCNWNIIPACEKCATLTKKLMVFTRLEQPSERQAIQNIVKYLEVKLDRAIEESSAEPEHTDTRDGNAKSDN